MFLHSMCPWLFKERKQAELALGSERVSVFVSPCRALIHLALGAVKSGKYDISEERSRQVNRGARGGVGRGAIIESTSC